MAKKYGSLTVRAFWVYKGEKNIADPKREIGGADIILSTMLINKELESSGYERVTKPFRGYYLGKTPLSITLPEGKYEIICSLYGTGEYQLRAQAKAKKILVKDEQRLFFYFEVIDRGVNVRISQPPMQKPEQHPAQGSKPSIEGFVWHGHFEGSEETAYLGKHHPQFPKWRKGVPGAKVRIWGPYADVSVTTDDRGHYEIYNLPPGEYHMMAERRVKPEKIQAGEYIAEGAEGGYLSQYVDKVVIPPPPDTAHQNFELKPLEEMSHKVSFTGGTRETRERIRKIFAHYKRIRFDRDKLDRRLRALVKAGVVPEENAKYIRQMFDYDLNEAKREMLKWEMERLKEKDNSLDVRSVRYVPSAIGKVNIFSDMTGNLKSNIKKSAGFLFAGVVASAVVGSPLFFFAFICFLISSILPTPNNYSKIRDRIEKINEYYENLKKSEKYSKAGADVEAQIEEQRKNDTMITISMLRDFRMESVAWSTGFKHLLHVAGFALLSLAFVLSSIPLAKPIGVIAALIAYASIKFQRTDTGVHEGGRARWLSRIISQDEV